MISEERYDISVIYLRYILIIPNFARLSSTSPNIIGLFNL
jgi:chemotaxis signal transduction protein